MPFPGLNMQHTSLNTTDLEMEMGASGIISPTRTPSLRYPNESLRAPEASSARHPPVPVAESMRKAELLCAVWSPRAAEDEAAALFAQEAARLQHNSDTEPRLPDVEVELPSALTALLSEQHEPLPQQLRRDEVDAIHTLAVAEDASSERPAVEAEARLLAVQCENLTQKLHVVEENKLALELASARLDRALPTLTAWLHEQQQKLLQIQQAVQDPSAVIGLDLTSGESDLASIEAQVKKLARQNAEMEQEGLIKSLNACHAMEMLTASLKFQTTWREDAQGFLERATCRHEAAQLQALADAKEEEALLRELEGVTSQMAETKKNISLTHARLLGTAPLPNGAYISEGQGTALLAALREELAAGSTRLLETLGNSHDYNVIVAQHEATAIPAYARTAAAGATAAEAAAAAAASAAAAAAAAAASPPPSAQPYAPVPYGHSEAPAVAPSPAAPVQPLLPSTQRHEAALSPPTTRRGGSSSVSTRRDMMSPTNERRLSARSSAAPLAASVRARAAGPVVPGPEEIPPSMPRGASRSPSPSEIMTLQAQAQRQLAGVAQTLKGLAHNAGFDPPL